MLLRRMTEQPALPVMAWTAVVNTQAAPAASSGEPASPGGTASPGGLAISGGVGNSGGARKSAGAAKAYETLILAPATRPETRTILNKVKITERYSWSERREIIYKSRC